MNEHYHQRTTSSTMQQKRNNNGIPSASTSIMDQEAEELTITTMTAIKDRKDNTTNGIMNVEEECAFDEKPHPKRSSVIEMWRKTRRCSQIQCSPGVPTTTTTKSSVANTGFQFEEKKQEDNMVVEDDDHDGGVDTSDRDTGRTPPQNNSILSSSGSASSSSYYAPRVVTPERSGPDEESGSNVDSSTGSASGLVRRSNVRDAWKKRNINPPPSASTTTKPTVQEPSMIDSPVVSPARDASWKERETPKVYCSPDSVTKGPTSATSPTFIDRSQSRDSGASSDQPSTGTSTGSSSAFDELRSKWAKFGVQKTQARETITTTRPQPMLIPSNNNNNDTAGSDNTATTSSSSSLRGFNRSAANTQSNTKKEPDLPPVEEAPATPLRSSQIITTNDGVEVEKDDDDMLTPNRNPDDCDSPQNGTTRKSHLVRLGQKHASRPKSGSPSRAVSPLKRNIVVKGSPKQSPNTSSRAH